ncbi:MAG TPA: DUF92 domain-containing protein [Bacillales bacterium]|nr:DUF92 domain-containing protein [Bacillales bacterium]
MIESIFLILLIFLMGFFGFFSKSLTRSGVVAAVLVGFSVFIGFGEAGLFLLGIFFASSSIWSKYKSTFKTKMEEKLAKGATRDWRQVFANGGTAAIFGIIDYFDPAPIWMLAFCIAIASANSDTWASEIGSLSKKDPIFIRTFKRIEKGTSGAVSPLGSMAALSGALLIALSAFWLFDLDIFTSIFIFVFGYFGNVIDTFIGAFYQQTYICQCCGIETERKKHCQKPTVRIKGIAFIDNDMVNFLSGLMAVITALLFFQLFV